MHKPVIGITMGDPASIGPEIAIKALLDQDIHSICKPLLIGDAKVFQHIAELLNIDVEINAVSDVAQAIFDFGKIDVFDLQNANLDEIKFGEVSAEAGKASFEAVKKVIDLALDGKLDATVTGPINKKSINEAGFHFAGHTEIYAEYTDTKKYAMLLVEENMKVIHVSTDVSLRQACDLVKKERIIEVVELLHNGLISLGEQNLKIGIAGLNPHAGDSGLFGTEDDLEILPAVVQAKELGYDVDGPVPADTLFSKAATGYYG